MRILVCMKTYQSGGVSIAVEQREPEATGAHPGMLVLHGSMGAGSYWMGRFAPTLNRLGIAVYGPRYLQKTSSLLATSGDFSGTGVGFRKWEIFTER